MIPLRATLAIYKDTNADIGLDHQLDMPKKGLNTWRTLGGQTERNKENNALPSKWTSHKVGTLFASSNYSNGSFHR